MTMTYPTSAELARTRRNGGFGVVELMVAMAISLLLLGGVVTLFTSSKTTYERVEHLSRIQETGRFALEAMIRDIRSAGYIGCARSSTFTNTLNSAATLAYDFGESIRGYDYQSGTTWSPGLPAGHDLGCDRTSTAATHSSCASPLLPIRARLCDSPTRWHCRRARCRLRQSAPRQHRP